MNEYEATIDLPVAPEEDLCGAPCDSDMHHHFQYRYQMNS